MSYFDYFNKNKDIDIYYYNPRTDKEAEYDNYYVKIKNYAKFNLISVENCYTVSAVNQFDFNCCKYSIKLFKKLYIFIINSLYSLTGKIFYSYTDDTFYVHPSFIFSTTDFNKMPSFFNIDLNFKQNYKKYCLCKQFKRTLKYFMKGFIVNSNLLHREIIHAKLLETKIINKKDMSCKICYQQIFKHIKIL